MSKTKCPLMVAFLAMLHIALGLLLVLGTPLAMFGALSGPPTHPGQTQSPAQVAFFQVVSLCNIAITLFVGVMLLAAGIGLLRVKPWARTVSLRLSVLTLLAFFGSRLAFFLVALTGRSSEPYWLFLIVGSVILCFPQVVHPLLTLAILMPQSVRDAFSGSPTITRGKDAVVAEVVAESSPQEDWYCRVEQETYGPMSKQHLDNAAASGRIDGYCEVWQAGSPARWAGELYPQLLASQRSGWQQLLHGPVLPPYQPSPGYGNAGWKWALLIATALYTGLLLATIVLASQFAVGSLPYLVMGIGAIAAGTFAMSASIFEWQWFFQGRQVRTMRRFIGDRGAQRLYLGLSCCVLLLGFAFLAGYAVANFDQQRLQRVTGLGIDSTAAPPVEGYTGQRSAQCGGTGGGGFERFDPAYRPVIGFRYTMGDWDRQRVICTIHPLYDRSDSEDESVLAEPGFQVVGLRVDSNEYVNAVQVVFARTTDEGVDQAERYTSPWLGAPTGRTPAEIGVDGRQVVGIFGRQGLITNALGLLLVPIQPAHQPAPTSPQDASQNEPLSLPQIDG